MRGLTIITGNLIDKYKNFGNSSKGKDSLFISNLLTPIVKAWCTDQSVYITSLGVQVHGGMGFIEDTGAAQYFRDSRILPIYEGTNGIQALDLLRRKLFQENGSTYKKIIDIIRNDADMSKENRDEELKNIGNLLLEALQALESCCLWLVETYKKDPEKAASGATPFMNMFGWILGGWVMVRSALEASNMLQTDSNDKFAKDKINTAIFYCNTYLPTACSIKHTIMKSYFSLRSFA